MHVKTGVEAEFFLISPDGTAISDAADTASKPCYDQQAVMRRYDVIAEICDHMLALGWGAYQNDHEDANGQFEMNWAFDDALPTADKHSFFKFMVKSIAEKHGLRATFMPKPFQGLTGNGCHAHISVWDKAGKKNVFADNAMELGLSAKGRNFLGGIMKHASALAAITNPTVNSYKRINAPRTISGATWAPNTVTWTGNNRTHMVRVPGPGRFELRLPDGAANPYLLQAVIIAAGLDGIRSKADPGKRYDIDMYSEGHTVKGAPKLPLNLLDALREYDKDKSLKAAMGEEFSAAYLKLKHRNGIHTPRISPSGSATHARHLIRRLQARREQVHEILDLLHRPGRALRSQELAAHLARRHAEGSLRRGDHRRRRPRPGDRLVPGPRTRHPQRRRAGKGLDRRRQCRPQHHDHPLQLHAARQYRLLRAFDEAVGAHGAGPQLQHDGQPARRHQPLPLRRPARRLCAARQRHAHQRHRCRIARPRGVKR